MKMGLQFINVYIIECIVSSSGSCDMELRDRPTNSTQKFIISALFCLSGSAVNRARWIDVVLTTEHCSFVTSSGRTR